MKKVVSGGPSGANAVPEAVAGLPDTIPLQRRKEDERRKEDGDNYQDKLSPSPFLPTATAVKRTDTIYPSRPHYPPLFLPLTIVDQRVNGYFARIQPVGGQRLPCPDLLWLPRLDLAPCKRRHFWG